MKRALSLLLSAVALLLLPHVAHAQNYGIGNLQAFEADGNTPIDRIPSGEAFDLIFGLHVSGSNVNPESHPDGTLTFDFGKNSPEDADFVGILGQPQSMLPDFQCSGGTDNTPLNCTWNGFTGTAFTVVFGFRAQAPFVGDETSLTIEAVVDPYDPSLASIGVLDTLEIVLTVEPGEMPATDLETLIDAPVEVAAGAEYTYDVTIRNNGPNPSSTFTVSTNAAGEVISGSHENCAVQSTVNLQCPGLGPLAPGESVTVEVTALADANPGNATLAARWINDALDDTAPNNDLAFHQLTITEAQDEADLSLECEQEEAGKQDDPIEVGVEEDTTILCAFSNRSEDEAENALFEFIFDPQEAVEDIQLDLPDGWTSPSPTTATTATLAGGAAGTFTFTFTPVQAGVFTTTFALSSETDDPAPANNNQTIIYDALAPDLGISILGPEAAVAGESGIRYPFSMIVKNIGRSTSFSSESVVTVRADSFTTTSFNALPPRCQREGEDEFGHESLRCASGTLAPGDSIAFGLEATSELPIREPLLRTLANVIPGIPSADEDFSNHVAFRSVRIVPPTEFVFLDPVRTLPSGVTFVNGAELTNHTTDPIDFTLVFRLRGETSLRLSEVFTDDGVCPPDETTGAPVCTGTLPPGEMGNLTVVGTTEAEGEAEICVEVEETDQEVCQTITVTPKRALPDLFVTALPVTDSGGRGDAFVAPGEEYTLEITVGNIGREDSQDSEFGIGLDLFQEAPLQMPDDCDLDPDPFGDNVICSVGPLSVGAQRVYSFRFESEILDPLTRNSELIRYNATIVPLNPVDDEDERNHLSQALILVDEREVVVDVVVPEQMAQGTSAPASVRVRNLTDDALDALTLTLGSSLPVTNPRGDDWNVDGDGSTTTSILDKLEPNESSELHFDIQAEETGEHEMVITTTVDGEEVSMETRTIEVTDSVPCTVAKAFRDDATPPVRRPFIYDIAVTAGDDSIADVNLHDPLPEGLRIPLARNRSAPRFHAPEDCEYTRESGFLGFLILTGLECHFPLAAGEARMIPFIVEAVRTGVATNIATACGLTADDTIDAQDLEIIIQTSNTLGFDILTDLGAFFNIETIITNTGSEPAPDVQVHLSLDQALDTESIIVDLRSSSQCTPSRFGNFADCNLGTLAPGESRQVTLFALAEREGLNFLDATAMSTDDREASDEIAIHVESREMLMEWANSAFDGEGNKQAAAIDVYIDDNLVIDNLPPGTATAFLPVSLSATAPRIDITDADAPDNSDPLTSFTADLVGTPEDTLAFSEQTLLLLTDTPGDTLGLVTKKGARTEAEDPTMVDVFFVHASPDAPTVELRITGVDATIPSLEHGQTSDYLTLDPRSYRVGVLDAATGEEINGFRFDLTDRAGQAVALVLSGRAEDGTLGLLAFDGQGNDVTTPVEGATEVPARFVLHGNYPNPFNPTTTLRFDLPEAATVRVAVYDVLGREVLTLAPGRMAAGTGRTVTLGARALASGAYLYRITAEGTAATHHATGRFVLLK